MLLYAHRGELVHHQIARAWLERTLQGAETFAVADVVLSGFLRVVTRLPDPTPLPLALAFVEALRGRPRTLVVAPGPRHWALFADLVRCTEATGKLVPDAYLAALAIETGAEWVSEDRDFARFPGLRWRTLT